MGKFEFELELQGFKVRMKGERADIPLIAQNIGKQMENLITPVAAIADAKPQLPINAGSVIEVPANGGTKRRRGGKSTKSSEASVPVDVAIDPASWGTPSQKWSTADKAIWLLYVVSSCGGPSELTSAQITTMFNARFREAGMVLRQNVNRDLLKLKGAADGSVGRSEASQAWFLTETGKKQAIALVNSAREQAVPGSS